MPGALRAQSLPARASVASGSINDESFAIGGGSEGAIEPPFRSSAIRDRVIRVDPDGIAITTTGTVPGRGASAVANQGGGRGGHAAPLAVAVDQALPMDNPTLDPTDAPWIAGPSGSIQVVGDDDEAVMVSGTLAAAESRAPARAGATAPGTAGGRGSLGAGPASGRMRTPFRAATSAEAPVPGGPPVAGVPLSIDGAALAGRIDLHGLDGTAGCFDVTRSDRYASGDDEAIGLDGVLKGAVPATALEASASPSPSPDIIWVAGDARGPGVPPQTAVVTADAAPTIAAAPGGAPVPDEGGRGETHRGGDPAVPVAVLAEARPASGRAAERRPDPADLAIAAVPGRPIQAGPPPTAVAARVSTPPPEVSPKAGTSLTIPPSGGRATGGPGDRPVPAPVLASAGDGAAPGPTAAASLLVVSTLTATSDPLGAGPLTATLPNGDGAAFIGPASLTTERGSITVPVPTTVGLGSGSGVFATAVAGPTLLIAANSYSGPTAVRMVSVLPIDGTAGSSSADPALSHVISGGGTSIRAARDGAPLPLATGNPDSVSGPLMARMQALTGPGALEAGPDSGPLAETGTPRYSSSADQTLSGVISGGGTLTRDPGAAATLPAAGAAQDGILDSVGRGATLLALVDTAIAAVHGSVTVTANGLTSSNAATGALDIAMTAGSRGIDVSDVPTPIKAVAANDR